MAAPSKTRSAYETETQLFRQPPKCALCRDMGLLQLTSLAEPWKHSADGVRAALDTGFATLCACAEGQFWADWFADQAKPMRDRDGLRMAFRSLPALIPDGMIPEVHAAVIITPDVNAKRRDSTPEREARFERLDAEIRAKQAENKALRERSQPRHRSDLTRTADLLKAMGLGE